MKSRFLMSLLTAALTVSALVVPGHSQAAELLVGGFYSNNVLRCDSATGAFLGVFGQADSSSGLNGPNGLAFGPGGNLYVGSRFTDSVLRYDGETGAFLGVLSGSELTAPHGLVFGADGHLYVKTDTPTKAVLRYDVQTGAFLVFTSGGSPNANPQFGPDGNLYVLDADSNIIRYDGQTGAFLGVFISPIPGVPMVGFTFGPDGNIYVAVGDPPQGPVLRFDGQTGAFIDTFVPAGSSGIPGLANGTGMVFGPDWHLYLNASIVGGSLQGYVLRYDGTSGVFLGVACSSPQLLSASYPTFRPASSVRRVLIDIKPGSDPNSINLSSAGVVPVAILSSPTFDATQVDPATVTLAGARVKLIGKGDRYACSPEDVNADGLVDLVCHVVTAQFMIEPGDPLAVLEAETFTGQRIRGEDSIRIVPD